MQIITAEQTQQVFTMEKCISLMRNTLLSFYHGDAQQIVRTAMKLDGNNVLGLMPAYIQSKNIAGTKVLTVIPDNYMANLPSHQGQVLVFDATSGVLKAIVDAEVITGVRTAAVSAVATHLLANKKASSLALLGAGLQARKHMEAMLLVRPIDQITVWDALPSASQLFASEIEHRFSIPVTACTTAAEAVKSADIICTLTPSKQPILFHQHVKPGAHINAVGACRPDARELETALVKRSSLFVDSKEAALCEAGDYLIPVREKAIEETHIIGELGALIAGDIPGRRNPEEITLFKALGLAVEDLAAADFIVNTINQQHAESELQ